MNVVKVSTSELIGPALDWAVGLVERLPVMIYPSSPTWVYLDLPGRGCGPWHPSHSHSDGGPLMHKHAVALEPADAWQEYGNNWQATIITTRPDADHSYYHQQGETPLIAGMRAIVGAHLGDIIEIPAELLEQKA